MTALLEARRRALAACRPPPRLPLSAWIEANLRLPEGLSALPGPLRLWPYQRGIADAIGDPSIERVTLVKPVRVGFTTLLTGALASYVVNEPAPILCLLPTESDARDYVVSDVEPIFAASPALRGLIAVEGNRKGDRSTILHRRFAGGSLKIVASKAPRNLRRHTARVLFIDEADAMEITAEGSPIRLAERRTLTFADRKIVLGSTPLDEETSHVLRAYAASDRRIYEVSCPECGDFTEILWRHIEWRSERPETAAFRCPHCHSLIEERHKAAIVDAGRWRVTRPEVAGHAGFRINALVSLLANASWPKLVDELLKAKHDTDELRVFVNTILAEGWRDIGEEVDEATLQSRAEPFSLDAIPEEVLALTAGADVQDDRLEVSIVGWTRGDDALVLDHLPIWGSPDVDSTWAEFDALLRSRWRHPWGGQLGVDGCVVDSGAWTDKVYGFCSPRLGRRIFAGKGVPGHHPAFAPSRGKVRRTGGGRLFLVGVDTLKTTIINRLAHGRSIRFASVLPDAYYEQLASERKVVRHARGQPVVRFERRPGARAEALDCLVYAFAARHGVPIQFDQRETELRQVPVRVMRRRVQEPNWIGDTKDDWI